MAATKLDRAGAIVAAALALPGVAVHAENAPEQGEVALKVLHYRDWQPGLKRITVNAPSLYVLAPVNPHWSLETTLTNDSVSGATPRYHSAISGATPHMSDKRQAADVKVTHYRERSSYALGFSHSGEHDYKSNAVSLATTLSSEDNNRTWNLGVGLSSDKIGSVNDTDLHKSKHTSEWSVGVTQALSSVDLVQGSLSYNRGRGFFSDPYKEPDARPDKRDQYILLTRWNHYFSRWGASMRTSYRYYTDSFGIHAHTLGAEWVKTMGKVQVMPTLRYYTQSSAKFYYDPVYDTSVGAPFPPDYFTNTPQYISPDQRLSAFGAVTVGLKVSYAFWPTWTTDLRVDRYEQRSNWRLGGKGSIGIDPFSALFVQWGLSKRF